MFKNRADWCVSRQRVWGVPIPVFYCVSCNEEIRSGGAAEPEVINHVADIFEKESADAWYKREAKELLPEGFKCPKCGGDEWTKETDILDVWFDSGSSWPSVFKDYFAAELGRVAPADVYLEGGDQFRGWFNSSLMVSLAKYRRAVRNVITHGWLITAQGEKMRKSQGTGISPNEVVKESGAEILRLWVASSDYFEDMRCSEEILERTSTLIASFATRRALRWEIFTASIRRATAWPKQRCWRSIAGRWRNLTRWSGRGQEGV